MKDKCGNCRGYGCDRCTNGYISDPVEIAQLGRVRIDPDDDRIRADMVREAFRRVAEENPFRLSWLRLASDSADDVLVKLYRMLNP